MNFGNMLYWALIFLVIAIVAGVLGFGGVAGAASEDRSCPVLDRDHPLDRFADLWPAAAIARRPKRHSTSLRDRLSFRKMC